MKTTSWLLVPFIVVLAGCQETASSVADLNSPLPVNVAPVTGETWYQPPVGVTWQWQLLVPDGSSLNDSYDVAIYDVDLFDTSEATIQQMNVSDGRKVICYFSAGSYENWRDDEASFSGNELGNTLDGWPDERWLDIRSSNVHRIMQERLDLARDKGCDGVEPDNMDGYLNDPGFNFTAGDQLAYNRFIANEAHKRGLSVGLKNDLDQVEALVDYFDFAVNEQCFEYDECGLLEPFIDAGKPVLNAEYPADDWLDDANAIDQLCNQAGTLQFSTLVLPLDLDDSSRHSCLSEG
ncbi:endo alpha-1,4 polygalactosaminidase [Saccharospirillum alexandrii]|uniref:endo alpha-1,4 polygalactosaminidase n=1 Tax=Saccharospirillum alexandrii TaxID=2448477 RepID=UPI0037356B4D